MDLEPRKSDGPAILESDKDAVIRMLEENEHNRKIVDDVSGGSDIEVKRKMQHWETTLQAGAGLDKRQMKVMECGLRWAVEATRQGRDEQQEQLRQVEQGQEQSKQGKQVRFGEEQLAEQEQGKKVRFREEEHPEKTRAQSIEQNVTGDLEEVRTGRGSAGLVRGEMRGVGRTRPAGKAKEKVTEERVNMKAKEEDLATKENTQRRGRERRSGSEWRQTWGPVAHTPRPCRIRKRREMAEGEGEQQCNEEKEEILKFLRGWQEKETSPIVRWAWADESTEEESNQEEVREERGEEMRWADCEDGEEKEKEEKEQVKEKETTQETGQEELTSGKPPGLEQKEETKQEAHEDEERRAEEAREEERRAQEAREEERRAQEAREEERENAGGARGEESAGSARERSKGSGGAREKGSGGARRRKRS